MSLTKSDLDKKNELFEQGIDRAMDHVKLVHISTLLALPDDDDLRQRLYDATNAGTLEITDEGDVRFCKSDNKE